MLTKELVDLIGEGGKLVSALDVAEVDIFRPRAAFWYYASDLGRWRLMLQLPLVDERGHWRAYRDLEVLLSNTGARLDISLEDVALQSSNSPLVTLVRRLTRTARDKTGWQHIGKTLGAEFIEEVYLYRI